MDDAAAVSQCLKGERRAYDVLVRKYQNAAFGLAFSYVRNAQDAEDAIQDAFVKGYLHMDTLRAPSAFGPWLKSIVVNCARQACRRRSGPSVQVLNLDAAAPELDRRARAAYQRAQARRELWDEVGQLPEIYRTVLVLHYASGYSYEETAAFLGLPVSTVRGRLQKARGKLRTMLAEDMTMAQVDVTAKVSEVIYKIARRQLCEEIELGDVNYVQLGFGVPVDVKVVGHSAPHVVVRGCVTAIGETQEQAEAALSNIEFLHDEVDDRAPPFPEGEKFCGTDRTSTGEIVANIQKSGGRSTAFDKRPEPFGHGLTVDDVFPHMVPSRELLARVRDAFPRRAHRVMLIVRKVTDLALPRSALTDDLREGFSVNSDWQGVVHGPVGRAVLEVAVPQGVSVSGGGADVQGISGNLLCMGGNIEEIAGVQGDVYLLHACARSVRNVTGNLLGFYHDRPGTGRWGDGRRLPPEPQPMAVENVGGDIELDLGHVDLAVSGAGGNVTVRNRTGNTTVSASEWVEGKRWRLEGRSGVIMVRLAEDLIRERHISGTTLSGEFDYAVPDELLDACLKACNLKMMLFSTRPWFADRQEPVDHLHADIWMASESGDIKIDRLPE